MFWVAVAWLDFGPFDVRWIGHDQFGTLVLCRSLRGGYLVCLPEDAGLWLGVGEMLKQLGYWLEWIGWSSLESGGIHAALCLNNQRSHFPLK